MHVRLKPDGSRQKKVIILQANPSVDIISQEKAKSIASRKKLVLNIQGYSENMTGNIIGSCRSWIRGIQVIGEC
jgi:hypothetical protein